MPDDAFAFLGGEAIAGAVAYFFYHTFRTLIFLQPAAAAASYQISAWIREGRKRKRLAVFRDGILALACAVRAGHSAEHAFEDAAGELALLYGEENEAAAAFRNVCGRIRQNVPLEQAVYQMAEELQEDAAKDFAGIFSAARWSGAELGNVILETVETIKLRLETEEEIRTMIQGRLFEQRIMLVMPAVIMIYLAVSMPGYFDPLYDGAAGRIIMSGVLALYMAAWYISDRIVKGTADV